MRESMFPAALMPAFIWRWLVSRGGPRRAAPWLHLEEKVEAVVHAQKVQLQRLQRTDGKASR